MRAHTYHEEHADMSIRTLGPDSIRKWKAAQAAALRKLKTPPKGRSVEMLRLWHDEHTKSTDAG